MSSPNQWYSYPKSIDEIPEFLDDIFKYAENNVWSKLLRGSLTKEWESKLSKNGNGDATPEEES